MREASQECVGGGGGDGWLLGPAGVSMGRLKVRIYEFHGNKSVCVGQGEGGGGARRLCFVSLKLVLVKNLHVNFTGEGK